MVRGGELRSSLGVSCWFCDRLMDLPPFLLDHWLARHSFASPPIAYDLASSTGPKWTVGELLAIGGGKASLDDAIIGYAPSEGTKALRQAIGAFLGVDPDWVVVTTGASEAYSILLCLAARPGANIVLPSPAYPAFEPMAGVWGLGVRHSKLARDEGFPADRRRRACRGRRRDCACRGQHAAQSRRHHHAARRDRRLAAALEKKGVPLIVDEVYHPLYFGERQASAASIDNVVAMGDMSKALSLAGLRIGWLVERDAKPAREDDRCAKLFHDQQFAGFGTAGGACLRASRRAAVAASCRGEREPCRPVGRSWSACRTCLPG